MILNTVHEYRISVIIIIVCLAQLSFCFVVNVNTFYSFLGSLYLAFNHAEKRVSFNLQRIMIVGAIEVLVTQNPSMFFNI